MAFDETHKQKLSAALKRHHANRTPEQKAAWREKVSAGTTAGLNKWHASRTEEHKALARERITAAAVCRVWFPRGSNPNAWRKGHHPVNNVTPQALARREWTKVQKASIKRIIKDNVLAEPEKWRDAIIRGRDARPPFSLPYVLLAATYLDTRANEPEPSTPHEDLSELTSEQLLQRAVAIAMRLQAALQEGAVERPRHPLNVIDVTPGSASSGREEI